MKASPVPVGFPWEPWGVWNVSTWTWPSRLLWRFSSQFRGIEHVSFNSLWTWFITLTWGDCVCALGPSTASCRVGLCSYACLGLSEVWGCWPLSLLLYLLPRHQVHQLFCVSSYFTGNISHFPLFIPVPHRVTLEGSGVQSSVLISFQLSTLISLGLQLRLLLQIQTLQTHCLFKIVTWTSNKHLDFL